MSLDFGLIRGIRQNLTNLQDYLVNTEIADTPWKGRAKEQLSDMGVEILFLIDELNKYHMLNISDSFQPYGFFRYLLGHFESLQDKIGEINTLVLQELRNRFDFFNQFEAKLSTLLEQLREHTKWEEEELNVMPDGRKWKSKFVKQQKSKFVKQQKLFAHWGATWLPVTIRDVLPGKYYNVHWTNSDEISSVHEDELKLPAKTGKRTKLSHNTIPGGREWKSKLVKQPKSKFVKQQKLFAHWGATWLPVTIRDVLPGKYYNVHWTNSDELSSVHEDELKLVKPTKTGKRTKPTMVKTFVKKGK